MDSHKFFDPLGMCEATAFSFYEKGEVTDLHLDRQLLNSKAPNERRTDLSSYDGPHGTYVAAHLTHVHFHRGNDAPSTILVSGTHQSEVIIDC